MTVRNPRVRLLGPALALLLAATFSVVPADRLHLEGGGRIDVETWWEEGDWLIYESGSGTVGIPRSSVLRVESSGPAAKPTAAPTGADHEPAAAPPALPASGVDPEEISSDMRLAHQALTDRDFETASSYFLDILRELPDLHNARVGYAVAEMALGRDGLALSAVLDGLALNPDRPEFLELLGDLRYRDERTEEALGHWRAAYEIDPGDRLHGKIEKGMRELRASQDYDFAASPHFNLRYDGDVDLNLAAAVMDHLEEQYWVLTDRFRHSPVQPITVQLFPTREFREVTQSPEWVGGLYDGKIRVPLGGLRKLDPVARRVLVHELTHAIVHSKTRGNCPRWLHEGLAQLAEGKTVLRSQREKIRERLSQPEEPDWGGADFSYASALALTAFLESRGGFDDLVYLLDLLGEGHDLGDVLERIYGDDLAALERDWSRSISEDSSR